MTRSRDTANIIPTVDAKGDLLVGTADNTVDNLSPGTNGQVLTANSATTTGLEWTTPVSNENFIINGAFDIWQRGTSTTTAGLGYYTADRFATVISGGSGTWSRETSVLPEGAQYGLKFTASSANTFAKVYYTMETIDAIKLAGKTITVSADFYESSASGFNAAISAHFSTLEDNASSGTWTQIGSSAPSNPSGVWYKTSGTFTIPSDAKSLQFRFENSSKMSSEHYIITNIQVEIGSGATPFRRNAPSIQAELAACQRYYHRISSTGTDLLAWGAAYNTSVARYSVPFPVTMRIKPTALEQSGTASDYAFGISGVTSVTCTGAPFFSAASVNLATFNASIPANSVTTYHPVTLDSRNSNAYLAWSAEL
jgi:hypothetical protein